MTEYDFHREFPGSGVGKQYPYLQKQLTHYWGESPTPKSLLDFGCGGGGTAQWLCDTYPQFYIDGYDPYKRLYPEWTTEGTHGENPGLWRTIPNRYYDCVYSADVLEHIPRPLCVERDGALAHINSCTRGLALLIIDLTPAKKTLATGTNAHVNLQSTEQWLEDIERWMRVWSYDLEATADKTYGVRRRLCVTAYRGKKM